MESGYHSETGICWQFRNKGDPSLHCKCPACTAPWPETSDALFGRCRSGSRWFWTAYNMRTQKEMFGWADTEGLAMTAAMAAVVNLRNGSLMTARLVHGYANRKLKELDEADRTHKSYGWWEEDAGLRAAPPPPAAQSEALHELKVTMAAAHPDRGGSNAAFIPLLKPVNDMSPPVGRSGHSGRTLAIEKRSSEARPSNSLFIAPGKPSIELMRRNWSR